MTTWSAPVRYAEVDGQGVVFSAHYLLYCDEAMSAYCDERRLVHVADKVRLVASTLTWTSGARWGEQLAIDVACPRVGRTSFALSFVIRADGRLCCQVEGTYVLTDESWQPMPVPDEIRTILLTPRPEGH